MLAPARRSSGGGPERVDGKGSGAEAARLTFFSLFRRLSGAPAASDGGSTADEGEGGVVGPTVRTATGILVPPATLRIIVEGGSTLAAIAFSFCPSVCQTLCLKNLKQE